jgi:hypothetical protein
MRGRLEFYIDNRWVLVPPVLDLITGILFSFNKLIEEGDQRYLSNEMLQVVCTIFKISVSTHVSSLPEIPRSCGLA